ncbi:MAG: DUF2490 domain-containing protein [Salinivirgaceae bacterium]|jgi:hypothetical protein|nr:DUF2490 domain-containing protein [Salinivirgaceae bacterium]
MNTTEITPSNKDCTCRYSTKYAGLLILFLLAIAFIKPVHAQKIDSYIWEPKLSVSKKLSSKYTLQGGLKIRQDLEFNKNTTIIERVEPNANITRKLFNNAKAGAGYVFIGDDLFRPQVENEHRILQYYSFSFKFEKFRLSNRIRNEQRMSADSYKNRLRYRLGVDLPLNGEKLNSREAYFAASNEVLSNFNAHYQKFENRFSVGVGWKIQQNKKIQIQLQHRISSISTQNESQAIYLTTSFYFSN